MNIVMQIGNLTKAPEMRKAGEKNVCSFTIAVNRLFGEKDADFHKVDAWGALADNCMKFLDKGRKVAVVGYLRNNNYTDGKGVERYETVIVAERVEFLGSKKKDPEA